MENLPEQFQNAESCLNCGHRLAGSYCGNCGQQVKELRRPFFRLTTEALHSLIELDGRAYRTLFYLLTKPAYLSREYFSGRRMSYTPPLRLFLVISVSFFLLVSFYTAIQSLEGALNPGEVDSPQFGIVDATDLGLDAAEDDDNGIEDILAFVDTISLPFFAEQTNANLRTVMRAQAEANFTILTQNPIEFVRGYLEYITIFMLLMMPLLALIQKIFYFSTGHYYSEHLVLTLHNHAFIIIVVFVTSLTGMVEESQIPIANTLFGYLGTGLFLWMWAYLYLSLKNYFQQGYGITLLKFLTTTILYGVVLGFGILVFSAILFFLF